MPIMDSKFLPHGPQGREKSRRCGAISLDKYIKEYGRSPLWITGISVFHIFRQFGYLEGDPGFEPVRVIADD